MKTFQEFMYESLKEPFKVGDVVHVKWHDTTGAVSHGTTNVDKVTNAYVHARHPNIPSLTIKVHQHSGVEVGGSAVKGHYKLHHVSSPDDELVSVGKVWKHEGGPGFKIPPRP